jgi:hypothetical protein
MPAPKNQTIVAAPVHIVLLQGNGLLDEVSVHQKPPQRGKVRPSAMDGSGLP